MLFNEDDYVLVTESKCGFRGKGQIVCSLHGSNYLVRVSIDEKERSILVNARNLKHDKNSDQNNGREKSHGRKR